MNSKDLGVLPLVLDVLVMSYLYSGIFTYIITLLLNWGGIMIKPVVRLLSILLGITVFLLILIGIKVLFWCILLNILYKDQRLLTFILPFCALN